MRWPLACDRFDFHLTNREGLRSRLVVTMDKPGSLFSGYGEGLCSASNPAVFAVLDGHGGDSCSEYCRSRLIQKLRSNDDWTGLSAPIFKSAFLALDDQFKTDCRQQGDRCGSCVIVTAITPEQATTANAGDCRAVLSSSVSDVRALSADHKPDRPDELARILAHPQGRVQRC